MQLGYEHGLHPNPIDVQQAIKSGETGFAISLPSTYSEPIWIPTDSHGLLRLDPNSTEAIYALGKNGTKTDTGLTMHDLYAILINKNAMPDHGATNFSATEVHHLQAVFNLGDSKGGWGRIEAGRLVTNPDGSYTLQAFATIRGSGIPPANNNIPGATEYTITPPEIRVPTHLIETAVPRPTFKTVELPQVEQFGIATPFAPRYPLEELGEPVSLPEPPMYYYGGESLEAAQDWLRANPRAHKPYRKIRGADGTETWVDSDGKSVTRSVEKEKNTIEEFLSEIKTADPNHYAEIERLAASLPPMKAETRVAVNIPAWMEGGNIYHLLEEYTRQTDENGNPLNPNRYEINIIINRQTGTPADNSVAEVERFINTGDNRKFQIHYVDIQFEPPFNNVGNARRVITNTTLLRSTQRPTRSGPLYIESEDADLIRVDPRTVTNIIQKLDANAYLDAVRGLQDRLPETMMQNDYLFVYRRAWDFQELLLRRSAYRPERNSAANFTWNRVITGGWNTAYTAEAYALIGGYNPFITKGEDMIMGERMSMARGDGTLPNTDVVGKVPTRTDSSPRRFIYEAVTGKGAYSEAFEDPIANAEIRNETPEELLAKIAWLSRIDNSNQKMFEQLLDNDYQFVKAMTPDPSTANTVETEILTYLGFKPPTAGKTGDFILSPEGNLHITNWSNIQAALNGYRARHQTPLKPGERTGYRTKSNTTSMPPTAAAQATQAEVLQSALTTENLNSIKPILDKLNTPETTAPIRLGKEATLDTNEIAILESVLQRTASQIAATPEMIELQRIVDEQSANNTAFGIAKFFNDAVIEDNTITSPQVIIEQSGPKIHVPTKLFRLWNSSISIKAAQEMIEEYRTKGYQGRRTHTLVQYVEKGLQISITAPKAVPAPVAPVSMQPFEAVMPQAMNKEQQGVIVNAQTLERIKHRIDRAKRIRYDVLSNNKNRVKDLRDLEIAHAGDALDVDARGFEPRRYEITYRTPSGEIFKEPVVVFARTAQNGQLDLLKNSQGRPVAINLYLFDSRLVSRIHQQEIGYDIYTIPRLDEKGVYSGIVTLRVNKDQLNETAQTPTSQPSPAQAPEAAVPAAERILQPGTQVFLGNQPLTVQNISPRDGRQIITFASSGGGSQTYSLEEVVKGLTTPGSSRWAWSASAHTS